MTAMDGGLQFNQILPWLLLVVHATHATFVQNVYNKIEPGENITGTKMDEFLAESKEDCSIRWVECYVIVSIKPCAYLAESIIVQTSDRGWDSGWYHVQVGPG